MIYHLTTTKFGLYARWYQGLYSNTKVQCCSDGVLATHVVALLACMRASCKRHSC